MHARRLRDDTALAEMADVSSASVSRWRSGKNGISEEKLRRLAEGLDIPYLKLADPDRFEEISAKVRQNEVDNSSHGRIQEVPLLAGRSARAFNGGSGGAQLARLLNTQHSGVTVLGVYPPDVLREVDHVAPESFVAIPIEQAINRTLQAVRVTGRCMEPEISAGDTVVIQMGRAPVDGEIVVAEHEGRTLIKRWWDDGATVYLEANREEDSLRAPKAEVIILGVVISGVYEVVRQPRRTRRNAH